MLSPVVLRAAAGGGKLHVSANTYAWGTYAGREGTGFQQYSDEALAMMAAPLPLPLRKARQCGIKNSINVDWMGGNYN
jgi:hypothetical protein